MYEEYCEYIYIYKSTFLFPYQDNMDDVTNTLLLRQSLNSFHFLWRLFAYYVTSQIKSKQHRLGVLSNETMTFIVRYSRGLNVYQLRCNIFYLCLWLVYRQSIFQYIFSLYSSNCSIMIFPLEGKRRRKKDDIFKV
jgi:hypothetical protein